MASLSKSALYRLLSQSRWDKTEVDHHQLETMIAEVVAGDEMLVLDDSVLPRKVSKCVGVAYKFAYLRREV